MIKTREEWLNVIIERASPMFDLVEAPLPMVRAALSPPQARRSKYIGLCWHESSTEDKAREIWISSALGDPIQIAGTLVHELCHAALPSKVGHKKPFAVLAKKLLLEGKPTSTTEGDAFKARWTPILEDIGPIPGAKFVGAPPADMRPKQETIIQRNVTCPDCGFAAKVRLDQMKLGRLVCPVEGEKLLMKCEMED